MSLTNFARNKILDNVFGAVPISSVPSNYYLALSTTAVSVSGSNVSEPASLVGYARQQIINNKSVGFTYSTNGSLVNLSDVTFPMSTGSWGTIVDVALYDDLTSGSVWAYTSLSSPKIIQDSTTITFSASSITISLV